MDAKSKKRREDLNDPPRTIGEARRRVRAEVQPFVDAIKKYGEIPDMSIDRFTGWCREAMRMALQRARKLD
jgi:hypothetical protein